MGKVFDPGLRLILLTRQRRARSRPCSAITSPTAGGKCRAGPKVRGRGPRRPRSGCGCRSPRRLLADWGGGPAAAVRALLLKQLVGELGIERVTPHDLRRTCLTWITRLGFGRDAMGRVANHRTSTVTDVYDRHGYADRTTASWRPLRDILEHRRGDRDEQRDQPAMMRVGFSIREGRAPKENSGERAVDPLRDVAA